MYKHDEESHQKYLPPPTPLSGSLLWHSATTVTVLSKAYTVKAPSNRQLETLYSFSLNMNQINWLLSGIQHIQCQSHRLTLYIAFINVA